MTLTPIYTISGGSGNQAETTDTGIMWFQWACPASGSYFFKTRDGGSDATNFFSSMAAYQSSVSDPTDSSQLTAVTLLFDQSGGMGGGFEMGAYVAFAANEGTTYVIGITARLTPATGSNLYLAWDTYAPAGLHNSPFTLGSCEDGTTVNFGGGVCVGQTNVPPSPGDQNYWEFGSYDQMAGFFTCRHELPGGYAMFCLDGGSWPTTIPAYADCTSYSIGDQVVIWDNAEGQPFFGICIANISSEFCPPAIHDSNTYWAASTDPGCDSAADYSDSGLFLAGSYMTNPATGGCWKALSDVHPHQPGIDDSVGVPNIFWQASATGGAVPYGCQVTLGETCPSCTFNNVGGVVGVSVAPDQDGDPQVPGNVMLLYTDCVIGFFSLTSGSFGVTASGSDWQMSPTFKNSDPSYGWDNVTIGLEIDGTSTGVTDTVTFGEDGTQSPTFTFSADPTSGLLTATFTFTRNSVQFGTIASIPLYPIGALTFNLLDSAIVTSDTIEWESSGPDGSCPTITVSACELEFTSTNGLTWFGGTIKFLVEVAGSGQLYTAGSCTPVTGETTVLAGAAIAISKPSVNSGTTMTVTPQWVVSGTVVYSYPTSTFAVTWS